MENKDFIKILNGKLDEYLSLIDEKEKEGILAPNTSVTYKTHSNNFVRWCKGDFVPGDRKNKNKN